MKTIRLLAVFLLLCGASLSTQAAEFCDDAYYVEQDMSNGATWDLCWEHRAREGIVYHNIHYTPANGARRKVLHQANLAQIHVPYDDNGARFHDISDYGIGGNYLLNLSSIDCPNGTILQDNGRPLICRQLLDDTFAYTFGGEAVQSETLSLYSVSVVGAYNYIPVWHFQDNGTIEPGVGATGALQRFGSLAMEDHGWRVSPTSVGLSHLHNYFWKLDFDLGSSGTDDRIEEINFIAAGGKRLRATTRYSQEVARSVDPDRMRTWRIVDGENNGNGHPYSYEILLRDMGHKDVGPAAEPFTHNDIYFTRENSCEIYASHNPTLNGCASNASDFVNGESLSNQDLVVWPSLTFYHVPRIEDTPYMDAHWNFFQIVPRDWHTSSPYTVATTNNPPSISSPGSQTLQQNSAANVTIQASDIDGDGLTFSAQGLPPGLSINSSSGLISGIATTAGSYTVTVTVSDGQASQSTLFNWIITTASGDWTDLGSYQQATLPTQPAGWNFFWNANGSIGNSAGYSPLLWTGSTWDGDGVGGRDSSELNYGHLHSAGGHAGMGSSQGAAADRYVISRYTTSVTGGYRIQGSSAAHSGCQWSNGLDLRVYVNDGLTTQRTLPNGGSNQNFDTDLGNLQAGSTIDVAVGPSGSDGCDNFNLNYNIQSTEAAVEVNRAPQVTAPNSQTNDLNTPVILSISASDPDGDTLTYSASGLPAGLSINSSTGVISGTPSTAGTFNSIVSVSDGEESTAVSFSWTISGTTTQWNDIGSYAFSVLESPPAGWSFLWNANAAIGNSFGYAPLNWYGYGYDSDGTAGNASDELSYGYLNSSGGHPGRSIQQGASQSRFVISRYTTPSAGDFRITSSAIQHSGCQWSDGLDLRVYVNDALLQQQLVPLGGAAQNFDQTFSGLASGSTIDVAIGPSGSDGCDVFSLAYHLQSSATTATNTPPSLVSPGDQNTVQGHFVNLLVNASDADGDDLNFTATGLPAGLSINSATGQISGTAANEGSYNVLIVVSDGQVNSVATLTWTVTSSSATWVDIGQFSASVLESPPTGWSFLWNANSPIGISSGYNSLQWYGWGYDSDGVSGADSSELAYGFLHGFAGHPGQGSVQGAGHDRYVISRFTTSSTGTYRLNGTNLTHSGCQWGDGVDLRVYVNDGQRLQRTVAYEGVEGFDLNLGALGSGANIDVAVGPSGNDGCDAFAMDYMLQKQQ